MRSTFWSVLLTVSALVGLGAIVYFIMHFATGRVGLPVAYWLVPLFGAAGGAVGGILRNENKLTLARIELPRYILLGVIGDVSVGLGGSCAVAFLFANTLRIDVKDPLTTVLLISLSFLAGAFGKNIVELAGEKLLARAKEEAKAAAEEKVAPSAAIAYAYAATQMNNRGEGEAGEALKMAEQALRYDPQSVHAFVEKGRALKLLRDLKGALATVDEALRVRPDDARLLYNRACYMALLKMSNAEVLSDLGKACQARPQLCELARHDPDFDGLRSLTEFRTLMLSTLEGALAGRSENTAETAVLRFSRACYLALLKRNTDEILAELRDAFAVDPKLAQKAHTEPDLEIVHNLPEFKHLVGTNP